MPNSKYYTWTILPLPYHTASIVRQLHKDPLTAFCCGEPEANPTRAHLALRAPSKEAVTAYHKTAQAAGGTDHGAPGLPRS